METKKLALFLKRTSCSRVTTSCSDAARAESLCEYEKLHTSAGNGACRHDLLGAEPFDMKLRDVFTPVFPRLSPNGCSLSE